MQPGGERRNTVGIGQENVGVLTRFLVFQQQLDQPGKTADVISVHMGDEDALQCRKSFLLTDQQRLDRRTCVDEVQLLSDLDEGRRIESTIGVITVAGTESGYDHLDVLVVEW